MARQACLITRSVVPISQVANVTVPAFGDRREGEVDISVPSARFKAAQDWVGNTGSRKNDFHASHLAEAADDHRRMDGGSLGVGLESANDRYSNMVIGPVDVDLVIGR
jgi:hypothetical protein